MDASTPNTNPALLVLRARQVITDSQALLAQFGQVLATEHRDPKSDGTYVDLDNAIWTMNTTLDTYQDGTLMTRPAGDPDQAPNPLQSEIDIVFALNTPLEHLLAARAAVVVRLDGQQGQAAGN